MATDSSIAHVGRTGFRLDANYRPGLVFTLCEWPTKTVRSTITLPYPSAGYGGAVLSISHQARYAAALLYSGQSEIGYELFALTPSLRHIAGLPYMGGESDLTPMQFSPDEALVAVAIEENPLWWTDPEDEGADWDTPAVGGPVEWAALLVHRIGHKRPERYSLVVDLPAGWHGPEDGTWPAKPRFEADTRISVWGDGDSLRKPLVYAGLSRNCSCSCPFMGNVGATPFAGYGLRNRSLASCHWLPPPGPASVARPAQASSPTAGRSPAAASSRLASSAACRSAAVQSMRKSSGLGTPAGPRRATCV